MAGFAQNALTFEDLMPRRERTERVSAFLAERLRAHLSVLYPLFNPRRTFGKHIGSRDDVPRADEAMAQLTQKYKEAAGRPFDLRQDLDDEALSAMEYGLEIYPWEYTHTIVRPAETRAINVVSPVRWVFAYRSDYTPSQVRALLAGKGERRGAALRHFIVNALALQIVLARTAGLTQLLQDLRYTVSAAEDPVLGKLPLLTISSALPSFRPGDELILTASRYSGVPSFIELVDEDAARSLDDPFRSELEALLM